MPCIWSFFKEETHSRDVLRRLSGFELRPTADRDHISQHLKDDVLPERGVEHLYDA